jgi:hypothetical protein
MLRFSRDPLLKKEDDLDDDDGNELDELNAAAAGGTIVRDMPLGYDDIDLLEEEQEDKLLEIRIKAATDVTVRVLQDQTVLDLKHAAAAALGKSVSDTYIRLIRKGRLLAPDATPLSELGVLSGDVIHAVMTSLAVSTVTSGSGAGAGAGAGGVQRQTHVQPQGPQAALQRGGTTAFQRRAFRGAGINAAGMAVRDNNNNNEPDSDTDNDNDGEDVEAAALRLGFDRLRNSGMRRQEVTILRAYFSRHVDRWIRLQPAAAQAAAFPVGEVVEPDPMRRRYMQEDAWMQAQGPASEFRLNLAGSYTARSMTNDALWRSASAGIGGMNGIGNSGSGASASVGNDRDFLWGFMLGFFVGFIMLVWVWMPTVPHKQKLGILTGISLQLALGMLKGPLEHTETDDFEE